VTSHRIVLEVFLGPVLDSDHFPDQVLDPFPSGERGEGVEWKFLLFLSFQIFQTVKTGISFLMRSNIRF
jgi:hypothetical protein